MGGGGLFSLPEKYETVFFFFFLNSLEVSVTIKAGAPCQISRILYRMLRGIKLYV